MRARALLIASAMVVLAACSYEWSRIDRRPPSPDGATGVRCDPVGLTGCGAGTHCSAYMPASGDPRITCAASGVRYAGEPCDGTGVCREGVVCWAEGGTGGGTCSEICTDTVECTLGRCDRSTALVTPVSRLYPCRF